MDAPAKLPVDASGRRPAFFAADGVDQLVTMMLELSSELWVLRERVFVIEAAAEKNGLPLRRAVERLCAFEGGARRVGADARRYD